jgi:nickel/cobalt transporter (NicO) family protein
MISIRSSLLAAVFLVVCLLAVVPTVRAMDYFGRPDSHGDARQTTLESRIKLPEPFRSLLGEAVVLQSRLNARLRSELHAARKGGSWQPALIIILASFLYGVLHAVGPGHGKVVVASYLLTRRSRFLHVLGISGMVAATQAVTAVVLAGGLAVFFNATGKTILDKAADIEMASYAAITLLGLWMAWNAIRPGPQRTCSCGHYHQEPGDGHHQHIDPRKSLAEILTTGFVAGLRPCSGAILVLLFTLANGIFPVGIFATLAMGAGVAITVAAVSVGAYGINRALSTGTTVGNRSLWLGRTAAFVGALIITVFGATALIAIVTGAIAPIIG